MFYGRMRARKALLPKEEAVTCKLTTCIKYRYLVVTICEFRIISTYVSVGMGESK